VIGKLGFFGGELGLEEGKEDRRERVGFRKWSLIN
jgi:hypothetical protein